MSEIKHIRWNASAPEELSPFISRQYVNGENATVARFYLKKGAKVPEHSHVNEQISFVLTGALCFTLNGESIVVRSGELLCIPSHLPHSAEALEDTVEIDVFTPTRQDWAEKQDDYLRK